MTERDAARREMDEAIAEYAAAGKAFLLVDELYRLAEFEYLQACGRRDRDFVERAVAEQRVHAALSRYETAIETARDVLRRSADPAQAMRIFIDDDVAKHDAQL